MAIIEPGMPLTRLHQRLRAVAGAGMLIGSSCLHRSDLATAPGWDAIPSDLERLHIRWPSTYEWAPAEKWVGGLRKSMATKISLDTAPIDQPFEGAVLIEVVLDETVHLVAIDYFDGDRLLKPVQDECSLVFKMQYRSTGYGDPRVVPGGYVPGRPYLDRYLAGLRHLRRTSEMRFDVYGRFGLSYATDLRRSAVGMLQTQGRFRYEGQLALLPYSVYLGEAARSHVCVDLPGNGDMCHRLIDYLAMGCCIVRPSAKTLLPTPLTDGVNIRYVRPDLSDLVDACDELVHDPDRRARMSGQAAEYFDRNLHIDALAAYYLRTCLSRLPRA